MNKLRLLGAVCACFFVLSTTTTKAATVVMSGTGQLADDVYMDISSNGQWWYDGAALIRIGSHTILFGGSVQSSSAGPDVIFRAGSTPIFSEGVGLISSLTFATIAEPATLTPELGAVHGSDNWMKVIHWSGHVSWAQLTFDFSYHNPALYSNQDIDPILLDIPLYVTRTDGADFTLAEAVSAASASPVPVPTAVWLFGSGLISLIGIAKRKKA